MLSRSLPAARHLIELHHQVRILTPAQKGNAMAYVAVTVQTSELPSSKVGGIADRLVSFARKSVTSANDNTGAVKHLKADRLPCIQSCQKDIFHELRQREERRRNPDGRSHGTSSLPRGAGLKARIQELFAVQ